MPLFSRRVRESTPSRSILWNTAGSLANALFSVIPLAIVTRLCGTETAGIFAITFSMAQMMYMVGCFELNNILVTDARNTIGLRETLYFRLGSNLLMWLCGAALGAFQGLSREKAVSFSLLLGYMTVLSWVELCESHLFHNRHLDLAGKSLALNSLLGIALFTAVLAATRSTSLAIVAMCVSAFFGLLLFDIPYLRAVAPAWQSAQGTQETCRSLFRLCLPLLTMHLVLSFIINAPKLAIDTHLSLTEQSYYGYLAMPASCVNLLCLFVLKPQMLNLSNALRDRQMKRFRKIVAELVLWNVLILGCVLAGGWLLGIPLLSLFYDVDLTGYREMLCLLLLGGSFYSFAMLFDVVSTILRVHQKSLPVYLLVALAALLGTSPLVAAWGLWGAAAAYTLCMAGISIGSCIIVLIQIKKLG